MWRVIGDRILVALPPEPDETIAASGLFVARDPDRDHKPTQGIVVQLGEKSGTVSIDDVLAVVEEYQGSEDFFGSEAVFTALRALMPAPFDVELGDCVLFPLSAGEEIHFDGVTYVILREDDLLGVVEKKEAA